MASPVGGGHGVLWRQMAVEEQVEEALLHDRQLQTMEIRAFLGDAKPFEFRVSTFAKVFVEPCDEFRIAEIDEGGKEAGETLRCFKDQPCLARVQRRWRQPALLHDFTDHR